MNEKKGLCKGHNQKCINETNQVNVSVLRREDDRGHDGRDGDDDQPQPGREEEGDEGAKDWRPGLIHNNHRLMIL